MKIVIVLALVVVAIILFAVEILPVDLVALIIMATLLGSGIISPEEGLSGFSNPCYFNSCCLMSLNHNFDPTDLREKHKVIRLYI